MAGEVVLIDPQTGLSYKAGGAGAQPSASSQSVTPASDSAPFPVVGNVAAGVADTGNPVRNGGTVRVATTNYADGQRAPFALTMNGALQVGGFSQFGVDLASSQTVSLWGQDGNPRPLAILNYVSPTSGAAPVIARGDGNGVYSVVTPGSSAANALNRQFTTVASSTLVVKASAGNLFGYNIVSGAVAGYVMFFDATTAPADGTVTPKMCFALAANASIQADRDIPIRFTTGITMVFSSTGPFTKTASATAFLAGDAV